MTEHHPTKAQEDADPNTPLPSARRTSTASQTS